MGSPIDFLKLFAPGAPQGFAPNLAVDFPALMPEEPAAPMADLPQMPEDFMLPQMPQAPMQQPRPGGLKGALLQALPALFTLGAGAIGGPGASIGALRGINETQRQMEQERLVAERNAAVQAQQQAALDERRNVVARQFISDAMGKLMDAADPNQFASLVNAFEQQAPQFGIRPGLFRGVTFNDDKIKAARRKAASDRLAAVRKAQGDNFDKIALTASVRTDAGDVPLRQLLEDAGELVIGPDGQPIMPAPPTPKMKPVYQVPPNKGMPTKVGEVEADAVMLQQPQPPRVTVNTGGSAEPEVAPDPASQDILSQTGLSINAFRYLTGQASQLARDRVTRERAAREAETWARAHGVDISTLPAQYKAYNEVLGRNIERLNNTRIMEQELEGTVENLQEVIGKGFSSARLANVWRIWGGQQVNDPTAQQYAFHLGQLRNELAAYYAAAAGRPGSGITITDLQEAERTIKTGIAQGGLQGLARGVKDSTSKMGPIMQTSVDRAQRAVWGLFGVGQNYKGKTNEPPPGTNRPKIVSIEPVK